MITTQFKGRLGNLCFEITNLFYLCLLNKIDFSNIVFNRSYRGDGFNSVEFAKTNPFFRVNDYINFNIEFFSNIQKYFIDPMDFEKQTANLKIIDFNSINFNKAEWIKLQDDCKIINLPRNRLLETNNTMLMLFTSLFVNPILIERQTKLYKDIADRIAIHIRRTDFQFYDNGKYLLSENDICKILENEVKKDGHAKFIFFSDDFDWCVTNLTKYSDRYDIIVHQPNVKSYNDIVLMSLCKKIIRYHSSFSHIAELLKTCYNII